MVACTFSLTISATGVLVKLRLKRQQGLQFGILGGGRIVCLALPLTTMPSSSKGSRMLFTRYNSASLHIRYCPSHNHKSRTFQRKGKQNPSRPLNPPTLFRHGFGPRGRPSPPSEGDRDQRWSDLGHEALSLSFFPFFFLFLPILAPRSDGSEPPPPPLSSTTFLFISLSSDPVLYRGDLLEFLGGSSLQQIPSLFPASIGLPSGRRDLLRRWMFDAHRVWGFFPAQVSINYPTLGEDYLKLFFLKSPCHTQIEREIRFDPVVCLAGIKDLNLLLFWTLAAVVALVSF
uniref:Uncharacterized protein n=1 Tax=Fagus sylvatica TaxID=28930 RepID=A0A2N9I350_FAGSY